MAETTTINTKVKAIRRFFADSKATNHPVKDHPISKAEEYVRDLYLDMLCVVAQYECSDTENGFTLIRRIMAACENTQPLEEYIKHSMEITTERTAEFIKQCKDNGLCEIFMVDSMLLSCSNGSPNAKQIAFLAQFGDMLELDRSKIEEISKFALAILEQDSDSYQEILNDNNEEIQTNALCYAKYFVIGLIICTSKKRHYFSKNIAKYNISSACVISTLDEVKFENLIISDIGYLYLKMIKSVVFENCHCIRGPLQLYAIDKVVINNCTFKWEGAKNETKDNYCIDRAILAELANYQMIVTNTSFSGYEVRLYSRKYYNGNVGDDYYYSGAVFYNKDRRDGLCSFDNCDFYDIHVSMSIADWYEYSGYTICSFKLNGSSNVTNCHFSNCTCGKSSSSLFSGVRNASNNVLVNSNPIK